MGKVLDNFALPGFDQEVVRTGAMQGILKLTHTPFSWSVRDHVASLSHREVTLPGEQVRTIAAPGCVVESCCVQERIGLKVPAVKFGDDRLYSLAWRNRSNCLLEFMHLRLEQLDAGACNRKHTQTRANNDGPQYALPIPAGRHQREESKGSGIARPH